LDETMQKIFFTLFVLGGALAACSANDLPPHHVQGAQSHYSGEWIGDGYLKVLGTFCPPAHAMKGYC
jgi:hypothetical protein